MSDEQIDIVDLICRYGTYYRMDGVHTLSAYNEVSTFEASMAESGDNFKNIYVRWNITDIYTSHWHKTDRGEIFSIPITHRGCEIIIKNEIINSFTVKYPRFALCNTIILFKCLLPKNVTYGTEFQLVRCEREYNENL